MGLVFFITSAAQSFLFTVADRAWRESRSRAITSWLQVKPDLNGRQRKGGKENNWAAGRKCRVKLMTVQRLFESKLECIFGKTEQRRKWFWWLRGGWGKGECQATTTKKKKGWRWPRLQKCFTTTALLQTALTCVNVDFMSESRPGDSFQDLVRVLVLVLVGHNVLNVTTKSRQLVLVQHRNYYYTTFFKCNQ